MTIGNATEQERIRPDGSAPPRSGAETMGRVSGSPEWETADIPDRDEFLRTLDEYRAAQAAHADAEARWEAITT